MVDQRENESPVGSKGLMLLISIWYILYQVKVQQNLWIGAEADSDCGSASKEEPHL